MLRLPLTGRMQREADGGRFARTLAILLGSGLAMLEALTIAAKSVGNTATGLELDRVIEREREKLRPMHTHDFPLREAELAIQTLARQVAGAGSIHSSLTPPR